MQHLSAVYQAKKRLFVFVPYFTKKAEMIMLKFALTEELYETKTQLDKLETIFLYCKGNLSTISCFGMDKILKSALLELEEGKNDTDLTILSHMLIIENVISSGFGMLRSLAKYLDAIEVEQALLECFDETIESTKLFSMLFKEYKALKND